MLWQVMLLLLGTSWLWAPHLNHTLSDRTSLISQYETPGQPYSGLFRACDVLTGFLIVFIAFRVIRSRQNQIIGWILLVVGIGIFTDPILPTTCHQSGHTCQEYFSIRYLLHAIETVTTSSAFFVAALYDAWLRRKLVSLFLVAFQVGYGILFISQFASHTNSNTLAQYIYQTSLLVWLAWLGREITLDGNLPVKKGELRLVKNIAATWAFVNGVISILVSLAHIHLLGKIRGLYFAGDSAWLAQHGVVIGVAMLYLSRHLARGEMRARQIFLAITGIEVIKYSVISPSAGLMILYLLTFCLLFVFRDDFDRGIIPLTWKARFKDLSVMATGLVVAALAAMIALDRDSKVASITGKAFDNLFDYAFNQDSGAALASRSVLLAHTISVFVISGAVALTWILFRPYKISQGDGRDYRRVRELLNRYSASSEDYFKLWPRDKDFYWLKNKSGFVAYKQVGPVIFALADPIASKRSALIGEFISWARSRRYKTCFLPVYENKKSIYQKNELELLQIGSSAVVEIEAFLAVTAKDKWWRWQRNRAEKSGYRYGLSAPPHSPETLNQLKTISDAWLSIGGHAERGFALGYFDNNYLNECRIHYLMDAAGKIIAFTNEAPQFNPGQTVTVDLLRYMPEFNNTMPYLIYSAISSLAEIKNPPRYFDLGFVPFAKASDPVLAIAKALAGDRFSFEGLEQFKNKFDPHWQPNYLAYDGDLADLAVIALNLEKAMEST